MKITAQYTTLIVRNLKESTAFYRDVLGFREGNHVVGEVREVVPDVDAVSGGRHAAELAEGAREGGLEF